MVLDVWATIAAEAASESSLWAGALRPADEREAAPVFSRLADERHALGLETIYEGYLLHYGRSRLFEPDDRNAGILLGDYLYAHGLVRVAATGNVDAVADLAELISLCAQARAEGRDGDASAWAATASRLAAGGIETARDALRIGSDPTLLDEAARGAAGDEPVERALAAHAQLVG